MAARDIALMNAVYPDVPAVVLPVDGGGTARFTEVSDTTATASDVASGKYFYTAAGVKTVGTASGGGSGGIVISDTTDAAGGTVRTITAVDLTNDTVTASSMLSGVTAHDNTGAAVTGDIASKSSSDLTANVLTVTAPAGYYESNATKTLSDANLIAGNIKKDVSIFGVTGTYEGGGGASNFVTGTFTGQNSDKGSAISISIPYTGNGYPVAGIIYPTGGAFKTGSNIALLAQQYAIYFYTFSKVDTSSTPTFSGDTENNRSDLLVMYKNSNSDATSVNYARGHLIQHYYDTTARATYTNLMRIRSKNTMSVFIASDSYGFPANIEFTYHLVYSS